MCLCFHYISILIHNFKPPAADVIAPPLCLSPADLASVWALPLLSLRSIPRKRKLIQDQRNTGTGIGVHTQHRKFFSDEEKRHRADTKNEEGNRTCLCGSFYLTTAVSERLRHTKKPSLTHLVYVHSYLPYLFHGHGVRGSQPYYVFWRYCCGQVHSPYILPTRTGSSWRII